ncbi:MAG TPA: hydroxymethylbilane synthase [Syntrophomonadaceae bacterium]|jgi:hydroxymethylbilane synthase|nr:hydroxymethylbilane synthase [Syntrophomonadaceae bacterium]
MNKLRLGTRGSQLALWQANKVAAELRRHFPELEIETVIIKTKGDKILDVALSKIGDKGLFTREIENALLSGEVDLAVHSMKDLPSFLAPGLVLGAVLQREDPRDVLVSHHERTLAGLPRNSIVGTSSLRRIAQLKNLRPDIRVADLRGNVETRIRKMADQGLDAIILAYAGVLRLGLTHSITEIIATDQVLPAVGQGAIAVEIRADNEEVAAIIGNINHGPTHFATQAERSFLRELEGGCQVPIGCLGRVNGSELVLEGLIASLDGDVVLRDRMTGSVEQGEEMGLILARKLYEQGGREILQGIRRLGD